MAGFTAAAGLPAKGAEAALGGRVQEARATIMTRRLYVVEYKDGIVKVGITTSMMLRLRALRAHGDIVRHHVTAAVCGFAAEAALLSRCRRIAAPHKAREFFCGLPFVVARQLADQVADRGYSDRTAKPAAEKRIGMGEASGDAITWRGLSIVPHGQMIRIARDTADGSASALIPAAQLERLCLRMLRQEALA